MDKKSVFLKVKERNTLLKLDHYNIMESPALAMSTSTLPENTLKVSITTSEGKTVKHCGSCPVGSALSCSCSINDAGFMVKDLTLKKLSVVSDSNRTEEMEGRNRQWQNLYNLGGESGNENLHRNNASKDKGLFTAGGEGNEGMKFLPEFSFRQHNQSHLSFREVATKSSMALGFSQSGFSQPFVKNALMEKEVDRENSEPCKRFGSRFMEKNNGKETLAFNSSLNCNTKSDHLSLQNVGPCPIIRTTNEDHEGINLREWLKPGFRIVKKVESMHIFTQIVEIVNMAHSQKMVLQDIRPSCFELLPSNKIKYVGATTQRKLLKSVTDLGIPFSDHQLSRKRILEQDRSSSYNNFHSKHLKSGKKAKSDLQPTQSLSTSGIKCITVEAGDIISVNRHDLRSSPSNEAYSNLKLRVRNESGSPSTSDSFKQRLTHINFQLEAKWYTTPEELSESGSTFLSNIYSLGVLLFELLCCCESLEVHAASMENLRNRILPPAFLLENPKETGFCLWLLHPEPSSRPTTREIIQSELMHESREQFSRDQQSSSSIDDDNEESELLLHFLTTLKDEKQTRASKLVEDIGFLEADLKEVAKRHLSRIGGTLASSHDESSSARELGFTHNDPPGLAHFRHGYLPNKNESRLTRNIGQLETAYFSVRSQVQLQHSDTAVRSDIDLIENRDILFSVGNENEVVDLKQKPTDLLGAFFNGLCKYARYSKFEQRAVQRNGDLLSYANVICSLSFDRDEDYFAAAGSSKKIKIFEFNRLLDDSVDTHYPVTELIGKSKLSCVCWNNYIKNYLASTDYDGDVQLWDASTGQVFSQYMEHQRRAWSADFSQVDPKKLASGSDDGSVKLWSISEFSAHSTNLLAFGSADYKTYCYDLRNTRIPWCTLAGHGKAVSFVKFLDSETLVSASTDNTLKLWDLNKTSSTGLSTGACSLTFSGHTNEKNFVGLSVSGGYIACGSETNEVFAYHRSLPMPITSSEFGYVDPISGQETCDENGQFVSSVCWRGKSNMVVAANSTGSIKVLQLV
ncbi:Spa1-related [Thalictrum thalictroides]|uniref:Spa1-related n=1 Tax=Thalictrum thalictroides TaxID=46969 RepID=A0A7J6X5L2_THATH|nr:Spa1-related [Thalictrum thalictroides]